MSDTRMDLLTTRSYTNRDGEVKTAWTKVGTAWATTKGWSLVFEALPLPQLNDKGQLETRVVMMPPKDDRAPAKRNAAAATDDDIPF